MLFSDEGAPFIILLAIDPHVITKAIELNIHQVIDYIKDLNTSAVLKWYVCTVVCCRNPNNKTKLCLYIYSDKLTNQLVITNFLYFCCTVVHRYLYYLAGQVPLTLLVLDLLSSWELSSLRTANSLVKRT